MLCTFSIRFLLSDNLFLNQINVNIPISKFNKPVNKEVLKIPRNGNNIKGNAKDAKKAPK